MAHRDPQHPAADPALHGADRGLSKISSGMEAQRPCGIDREHAVGDAEVQVGVGVQRRAEALHERDRPAARAVRCIGAAAAQPELAARR